MSIIQWFIGKRREQGVAMIYVLLMAQILTVVTAGLMLVVTAEATGGVRQLQAVRAFAVAEGGMHYALARLQGAGAGAYTGEGVPIVDGGKTLGTATVTVSCLDGGAPPCGGSYANYRRIVAQGALPVSGPRRTLTVTVMSSAASGVAVCAGNSLIVSEGTSDDPTIVYSDVASNGTITLNGTGNRASEIRNDPPDPLYANLGYYTGSARATGAITCAGACNQHVEGSVNANLGTPICPMPSLPTFSPGSTNLDVAQGETVTLNPATAYGEIHLSNGTTGGGFGIEGYCSSFTTLVIPAGAAGTTTVVHASSLYLSDCSRVVISGAGNIELRLAETSSEALEAQHYARLGVLPTDLPAVPAPAPAGQLKIITRSTSQGQGSSALDFDGVAIVSAILQAPNGGITYEPSGVPNSRWYGGLQANDIRLGTSLVFTYDPSISQSMGWEASSFGKIRGWKDQ